MSSPVASTSAAASSSAGPSSLFKKKKRPIGGVSSSSSSSSSSSNNNGAASKAAPQGASSSLLRAGSLVDEDDDGREEDVGGPTVVHKARKLNNSGPLVSSTGISLAKRNRLAATQHAAEGVGSVDGFEDEYSSVSARAQRGSSSGRNLGTNRDDATRQTDWYDEDADAAKKKASGGLATGKAGDEDNKGTSNDDGVYRGMASYTSSLPDSGKSRNKYTQRGPIQAPNNIRTITVMDYQPDVCKDYKETGYCGFGDTCKFLHDRSDYLAGWQMESAYLPNSNARNLGADAEAGSDDDEEEEVPFACLICRQPFEDPVQTRCGHYFCSGCAIRRFSKTPKCFACGSQTGGIFNSATKVIERMEKRRQAKSDEKKEVRRGWGQVDDDANDGVSQAQLLDGVDVGGAESEGY